MIQVHVGDDQPLDRIGRQARAVERVEQAWDAVIGAGVDERGARAFDDEVCGVEARAVETGVDHANAERQRVHRGAPRRR